MTWSNDKSLSSRGLPRGSAVVLIALSVLSGCASTAGEKPSDSPPKIAAAAPTTENTLGLLPLAADLGNGFAADSVDAEISPALREGLSHCAVALGLVDSTPSPVHRQGYIDAQGRILEVRIDFPAELASAEAYQSVDMALDSCEPYGFHLDTTEIGVTIAGGADEGVGDQAFRVAASLTADTDGRRVTQNFYLSQFVRDGIVIQIRALDAVDGTERIRFDTELLIAVSTMVDEAILAMGFLVDDMPAESTLKANFRIALTDYLYESGGLSDEKVDCVVNAVLDTISDSVIREWQTAHIKGLEEPRAMVPVMQNAADACAGVD